jgi:class 3 adenylate cyclase
MRIKGFTKANLNATQLEALQQVEWRNERLIAHVRLWLGALSNIVLDIFNACTSWQKFDVHALLILDLGIVLYSLATFIATSGKYKAWVKNVLINTDILVISVYSYFSMPGILLPSYFILVLLLTVFRYRAFLTLIATIECILAFILVILSWQFLGSYPIWEMPGNTTLMMYSRFFIVMNCAVLIGVFGVVFIFISRQEKILVVKTMEREKLARFLPRELVDEVESGRLTLEKEGRKTQVTILFADILDFTSLSEKLLPEKIVYLLNKYSDKMVQVIFAHGGILDKFTGDGLMAVFGVPHSKEDDQLHAANAAIMMKSEIGTLNEHFKDVGLPTIKIGIGMATGEVVAGSISTVDRITVIGNPVNLAQQLQSYCKELGAEILVEEITVKAIKDKKTIKEVGAVHLPKKDKPIKVWTLA